MNQVSIKVEASPQEGKTIVALLIEELLREHIKEVEYAVYWQNIGSQPVPVKAPKQLIQKTKKIRGGKRLWSQLEELKKQDGGKLKMKVHIADIGSDFSSKFYDSLSQ